MVRDSTAACHSCRASALHCNVSRQARPPDLRCLSGVYFRAYSYYNRTGRDGDDERPINGHTAAHPTALFMQYPLTLIHKTVTASPARALVPALRSLSERPVPPCC